MATTRITRWIDALPARVYAALLDPDEVRQWMVPNGMTSEVLEFDAREGGTFRITLTYETPTITGKTTTQSDTFHGRFLKLVPGAAVVQAVEFESDDPAMQGEMTITYQLTAAGGGTELTGTHEHLPIGVSPADNELGWSMSIAKLAHLVEAGKRQELRPIGRVRSPLVDLADAPRQGDEGAPEAELVIDDDYVPGLAGIDIGDELLVLTWLHRASRDVLSVRPRGDPDRALQGVFMTRSPDRPNPIGLHRVVVVAVADRVVRVRDLEAVDGTPIVDIKPVLGALDER
jgi:tRNA-Thr(GGU) m(6)t(6)A37 methyltransferase TsaA